MNNIAEDILIEFTERAYPAREAQWSDEGLTLHRPAQGPKDNPAAAKARMARFKAANPNYWRDRYKARMGK